MKCLCLPENMAQENMSERPLAAHFVVLFSRLNFQYDRSAVGFSLQESLTKPLALPARV